MKAGKMPRRKTREEFIEDARQVHGDKYNYSKVVYKNNRTKVMITCSHHREFSQSPDDHLMGCGCPKCGLKSRSESHSLTQEEFLEKAHEVHGKRYSYDKTQYVNGKTKVVIICPEHGDFEQTPGSHIYQKSGCLICGGKNHKSQEEFLKESNEVHGDRYDYSKTKYVNSAIKVIITCPEHGDFEQVANSHLQGAGCDQCGGTALVSQEEFLKRSNETHGNRYDYSKTKYTNSATKVIITCPEHGDFEQVADSHMRGVRCWLCGVGSRVEKQTYTQEDFLKKAREVHGNKYNYDKTQYVNSATKVVITCPKHGDFAQTANSHMQGVGCPKCKESKGEKAIREHLESNLKPDEWEQEFRTKIDRVDFVLTKLKTLIEYQGEGHYWAVAFNGMSNAEEKFEDTIRRDDRKLKRCQNNNIPLLLIPYWDLERVEEILDDVLAGKEPTFSNPPEAVIKAAPKRQKIRDKLGITEPEILCGLIRPESKEEAA
jgi:hypothetical protein